MVLWSAISVAWCRIMFLSSEKMGGGYRCGGDELLCFALPFLRPLEIQFFSDGLSFAFARLAACLSDLRDLV